MNFFKGFALAVFSLILFAGIASASAITPDAISSQTVDLRNNITCSLNYPSTGSLIQKNTSDSITLDFSIDYSNFSQDFGGFYYIQIYNPSIAYGFYSYDWPTQPIYFSSGASRQTFSKTASWNNVMPGEYYAGVWIFNNNGTWTQVFCANSKAIKIVQQTVNQKPTFRENPKNVYFDKASGAHSKIIDLWAEASDPDDQDSALWFRIVPESPYTTGTDILNCYLENDSATGKKRYFSCNAPAKTGLGKYTIEVADNSSNREFLTINFEIFTFAQNTAPTISALPNISLVKENGAQSKLLDLYNYASDSQDSDDALTFTVYSQTNTNVTCYIESNRYLSCYSARATGTDIVTLQISDSQGLYARGSLNVSITSNYNNTAPNLTGLSDVSISENSGSRTQIFDLWNYASDDRDSDSQLNFSVYSESNTGLIDCYIESNRYFSCNSPSYNRTGTSTITLQVTDTQGLRGSNTFNVIVNSNGSNDYPNISGLPDVEVNENSSYRSRLIDLWSYSSDSEDSDSELDFRIRSQSNTGLIYCTIEDDRYFECESPRDDSTGESTIVIEVEDSDGRTDSDTFIVEVTEEGISSCTGISVATRTIYMDSSDSENVVFDIRNRSNSDFTVEGVDISNTNGSYLSISNVKFDKYINEDEDGELEFKLKTSSNTGSKEATVYISIRGRFDDGRSCGYYNVKEQSFRVSINGYNSNSGMCSEINVNSSSTRIAENSKIRKVITITNSSDEQFNIDSISASESNAYFDVKITSKPSSVPEDSSKEIALSIESESVSANRSGEVELTVSGRFENGKYCSSSNITERFNVTVENNGSSSYVENETESGTVSINFSNSIVSLSEGTSGWVTATIANGFDTSKCFDLSVSNSNSNASASLSESRICLSENESKNVTVNITGRNAGNSNIEFKALYDGKTKSKFISAEIASEIQVEERPQVSKEGQVEIVDNKAIIRMQNNGQDLRNVTITIVGAPEGVNYSTFTKELWAQGEEIQTEIALNGFTGEFASTLRVSSDNGSLSVPVSFAIEESQAQEGFGTGLLNLATSIGLVLGLIIIIVLVIAGIIHIFAPAQGNESKQQKK